MSGRNPSPPQFLPGSFRDFENQSLENSERATGTHCPPPGLLSGALGGGKGGAGGPGAELASAIGRSFSRDGYVRVAIAGNVLQTLITPDSVTKVDRVFRKNPPPGMQSATPNNPVKFELGTIEVPKNMSFVVLDTRFALYVPTGIPGDVEELEDRRLALSVGWDMTFLNQRQDNATYNIQPSDPSVNANGAYQTQEATSQAQFAQIAANGFAGTTGTGLATLPQRHRRDSQFTMPFTYIVQQNNRVSLSAVVFRRVPLPLAFFEGAITGLMVGTNEIERFMRTVGMTTGV